MKVEQLPEPKTYPSVSGPRCSRLVKSTGTANFQKNNRRCARVARFKVDGVRLCEQHAGSAALSYFLKLL